MSAVSPVTSQVTLNVASVYPVSSVVTSFSIPANITIQGANGTLNNGNGAALLIDLAAWGSVSLASTTKLVDFSALPDPNNVTQNWTGGRCRLFVVQVTTLTAGDDLEVYSDATNGVSFLPPIANFIPVRANGGILLMTDFNSNGSGIGNVITSSLKRLDFNSGSNTVAFNWMALGSSVA